MFHRPPSNVARYALTFLVLAVATLLRFSLNPIVGSGVPFILYFPAVVICAWWGGLLPGLLSTALGGLIAWFVFIPTQYSFRITDRTALVQLTIFLIGGGLISLLAESLHRARRQAEASEAKAREQGDQLRVAMEGSRMGSWTWTIASGEVAWSPGLEAIHGFVPGTFPGTFEAFRNDIHPDDRDHVLADIASAAEGKRPHYIEYRIVRPDGAVRWVEGRGQLFRDPKGRPDRMVGVCMDITERKQAEQRIQVAIEAAPNAMILADQKGTIILVNDLTRQLLGYARTELIGQTVEQLVPPRLRDRHVGHRAGFFSDPRRRPMGQGRELYALRKDGSEVPVEIGLSPFETGDGAFVLAAITDITARKLAEDERVALLRSEQTARQELERANRLKDEFLAIVSHELRAPLTAVLGWAEMLRKGGLDEERHQEALDAVYANAKRQAILIDDLLDVGRIMSGKLRLEKSRVDLQGVVQGALEVIQPSAEAKRIHISTAISPTIGDVIGDATRLQQVVWNLLTNAIKFTSEGGAIDLVVRQVDNMVDISVTDTGKGISADFLPRLFEPFQQADGSTTRSYGGLGLGLSIVKHLVESHGGTVTAESAGDGHGSTFTIRLPFVPESTEKRHRQLTVTLPAALLEGITVLVADDDRDSRNLVAAYLEGSKASVITAASAAETLAVLDRQHVDVLIVDIAMPREDGYSLIRKVRASERSLLASIPAIALTALTREEDRQQALQAGYQLHLGKPVELRALTGAVASLAPGLTHEPV